MSMRVGQCYFLLFMILFACLCPVDFSRQAGATMHKKPLLFFSISIQKACWVSEQGSGISAQEDWHP